MTPTATSLDALRQKLRGTAVLPGEPGWDDARSAWNLAIDQRPAAVVQAADAADVQATVRFAAAHGLRVAPQSTGHGAEALPALDGVILLKTSALRDLSIDPASGTARIGAGAQAADVGRAAAEHGLAAPLGLASSVGVTGLTLGGGTGWLSRAHGLTAENAVAFELVTPDGELRTVDAGREPDLFWALRGGGGRFGVVTAVTLRLHPLSEAFGGFRIWPAEHAPDVLEGFRRLIADAPDTLSAVFRFMAIPDVDGPPPFLRGKRVVSITAVHLGGAADGERALAEIRAGANEVADTFGPIGPGDLSAVANDPDGPVPAYGGGFLLDRFEAGTLEAAVELIAGDALDGLTVFELRQLGGAIARGGDGALGAIVQPISVFLTGPVTDPDAPARLAGRIAAVRDALSPWESARTLQNLAMDRDPTRAFGADAAARLEQIRASVDPEGLLVA
ncbi:MAG: FAD-binding oxidoreductase [Solirubrobacteraceae bacterium]|nr:FAD-binding oxidoreductase [Solirubrobacteraceae bacterium]